MELSVLAAGYEAGDLVFCHSKGMISWAIRWAQRLRNKPEDARWNHVAVLDKQVDGEWYVIQAEAKGVTNIRRLKDIAPGGKLKLVRLPETMSRKKFIDFIRSQVSDPYGFLTIVSIAVDFLLPQKVCIRKSGTWVCSALVAGGLWYAGFPKAMTWEDLYQVTPADLYALMG